MVTGRYRLISEISAILLILLTVNSELDHRIG